MATDNTNSISKLESEIKNLKTLIKSHEKKIKSYEDEIKNLKTLNEDHEANTTALVNQNNNLRTLNIDLEHKLAVLNEENGNLIVINKDLESEMLLLNETIEELRIKNKEYEKFIDNYRENKNIADIMDFLNTNEYEDSDSTNSTTASISYTGFDPCDCCPDPCDEYCDSLESDEYESDNVNVYHGPTFIFNGPVINGGDLDIITKTLDQYYKHLND